MQVAADTTAVMSAELQGIATTKERPREWGRRLYSWLDKGVSKVPEHFQDMALHYVYTALSSRLFDTRRNKQNRLDWHWNNQVAAYYGDRTPDEVHGESKLAILHPLYCSWGADDAKLMILADEFTDMVAYLPSHEHKCRFAFNWLRSKDINVKQFAEYLTIKQRYWAEQGVILESADDLYYAAIGAHR